jgi:hypothetical protein
MIVSLPKLQIASLVITVLASATLSYALYHKAGSVSSCHGRLAQLRLLDTQLDATEAKLDAAEAQLDGIKR